jgi:methylated-DNA-[protein]-cysteine S-methyltransferase
MTANSQNCRDIEPAVLATAMGEVDSTHVERVKRHLKQCPSCRLVLKHYSRLHALVVTARRDTDRVRGISASRKILERRLADLRRRLLIYGIFPSPLGPILIARSEKGVSLVEYLVASDLETSRLSHVAGIEAVERRQNVEGFYEDLLEYLAGRRTNIKWPLDLRFACSGFQRKVLQTTAKLPYGAVTSYATIAGYIGETRGACAVAQALRSNPLPIAIPCHRVIGSKGFLSVYTGEKAGLKRVLLTTEGVRVVKTQGEFKINPEIMYACAPGDRSYCLPTCRSLKGVKPGRATLFGSRATAEAAGRSPCTTCRPDLYSLSE